jgi:multiple sugar transport system substrate-binding protein
MSPEVNAKLVTIANAFPGNVNAKPDLSQSDPLFTEAFEIFQQGYLATEFGGLPVAEELMRQMDIEVQKMFDGQQTAQEAAAATQTQWEAEFAK